MIRTVVFAAFVIVPTVGFAMDRTTTLVVHDEATRLNCNDGYTWDADAKLCIADPYR